MDTDGLLIDEVGKQPCLYNIGLQSYTNRKMKECAWQTVAMVLNSKADTCKKRWKALREKYKRERAKSMTRSSLESMQYDWNLLKPMSFVDPFMRPKNNLSNLEIVDIRPVDDLSDTSGAQEADNLLSPVAENLLTPVADNLFSSVEENPPEGLTSNSFKSDPGEIGSNLPYPLSTRLGTPKHKQQKKTDSFLPAKRQKLTQNHKSQPKVVSEIKETTVLDVGGKAEELFFASMAEQAKDVLAVRKNKLYITILKAVQSALYDEDYEDN